MSAATSSSIRRRHHALLAAIVAAIALSGCSQLTEKPILVSHRAQGFGVVGENLVENVPLPLLEGVGVEIDIRGDGDREFELGHNVPEGETLEEALTAIENAWTDDMAGLPVFLDIANDAGDRVSRGMLPYLDERLVDSPLKDLIFVVESANEETMSRLDEQRQNLTIDLDVRLSLTYWTIVSRTAPRWLDYVTGHQGEIGHFTHPKPLLLFGADSRASWRQAREMDAEVYAVIVDHPRRWMGEE